MFNITKSLIQKNVFLTTHLHFYSTIISQMPKKHKRIPEMVCKLKLETIKKSDMAVGNATLSLNSPE
jgi:hypothetical protein